MILTATTLSRSDDRELAVMLADGRQEALSEAYRRHSGQVFGLALKVTRDRTLAEEVSQEVFVRLWRRPGAYDPDRGSLRSFLLSHAHGRSVDLIRSEASRRRREEKDGTREAAKARPSIEEEILELETAEKVRDALDTISEQERAAIELAYFAGHSYREVAHILGAPEGTVKSRIRSGLRKLGTHLTELGT